MSYYYVDDIEASLAVVHMIQECTKYVSIPTVVDGDELKQKLNNLDILHTTWTDNKMDDSSYQSEVYKRICGKYYVGEKGKLYTFVNISVVTCKNNIFFRN